MQENFLHFLWQFRRFKQEDLQTTMGDIVGIQDFGTHNFDAGPDFNNARIQIGETLWAGNVEMHLKASDWKAHKHQEDVAYNNVILHVVLEEDEPIFRESGERIPCLELRQRIPPKLSKIYLKLWNNQHWIPCQHHFYGVSDLQRRACLDRVLVERIEAKTKAIETVLERYNYDWEAVFYQFLARSFGVKINSDPFQLLAEYLPLSIILKHKNSSFQVEALLYGQSGLLDADFEDKYPQELQEEYRFLQKKYQLQTLKKESWKFMRLRPANFPTIRIAQLASLLYQSNHLFSKMLVAKNVREIENMFAVQLSNYWQTHYVFDKLSIKRKKSLGKSTIHLIIINTIVPFLFLYGKSKDDGRYKEHALALLEELPPEKNSIIAKWAELGIQAENAYETQALLHLKKSYCDRKACLNCSIGNAILK